MRRFHSYILLVVAALPVALTSPAYAKTVYVDDDAPAPGDGTSWATAYRFLQDALTEIERAADTAEIRVAQGLYRPNESTDLLDDNRESTFRLPSGTTLRGGYAGLGAPEPNAWNPGVYETILTGDLRDNDLPLPDPPTQLDYWSLDDRNREDNTTSVIAPVWGDSNVVVEGVVITGASPGHPAMHVVFPGAGLHVGYNARATVRNCVFRANVAPGIYCESSTLVAEDCIFHENVSTMRGGGLLVGHGDAHLRRCVFERNCAREGAGVCYGSSDDFLCLEECIFHDNCTPWESTGHVLRCNYDDSLGGGLHAAGPGVLLRCEFQSNRARAGGAAYLESDWTLIDCTFRDNRAYDGAGALLARDANLDVSTCMFVANTSLGDGGAVYNFGSTIDLAQCLFAGNNAAGRGGSIFAEVTGWRRRPGYPSGPASTYSHVVLTNCTAAGNRSAEGRTISCYGFSNPDYSHNCTAVLSSCILDNDGNDVHCPLHAQIAISYTDLRGGFAAIYDPCESIAWGPGNIDVDPLFVDPGYWDLNGTADDPNDDYFVEGDYHLKSQAGRWDPATASWVTDDVTSPCIDAGDPNNPVGAEPFPNGGIINMGAYGGTAEASKSYPSNARVIYVDDDALEPGDGLSWSTAYRFLQDALTDAGSSGESVEIRVAQGLYRPDQGADVIPGDREATFRLSDNVALAGGFAGLAATLPDARDVALYQTILSGDLAGDDSALRDPCDLLTERTRGENSYAVVTAGACRRSAILDGFTITAANALEPGRQGAGLLLSSYGADCCPSIRNCTFRGNGARYGGAAYTFGAAPEFIDCAFLDNAAAEGGAIAIGAWPDISSLAFVCEFVIHGCTFTGNYAQDRGGAISLATGSSVTIADSRFIRNATEGEGGALYTSTWLTLANCLFLHNAADQTGGAIYCDGYMLNVASCTLVGNMASSGRALTCFAPLTTITNTILRNGGNGRNTEISIGAITGLDITYSNIQGESWPGQGNIDVDPLFADPGHWHNNGTPDDPNDDVFIVGDYHLKSQAGRCDPATASWVQDDVTSPCIDAGDPNSSLGAEPYPNGGIINMGAYGGTAEASLSASATAVILD